MKPSLIEAAPGSGDGKVGGALLHRLSAGCATTTEDRHRELDIVSSISGSNARMRLALLRQDLRCVQIALEDFEKARALVSVRTSGAIGVNSDAMDQMFHHAKTFVCGMRRFSRLLEAADSKRAEYPRNVASVIRLEWKANRAFLEGYSEPRNAIEHIDGEVTGANHRFLSLQNDFLEVVPGTGAAVSRKALSVAESAWRAVVIQVEIAVDIQNPRSVVRDLLRLLALRKEQLSG